MEYSLVPRPFLSVIFSTSAAAFALRDRSLVHSPGARRWRFTCMAQPDSWQLMGRMIPEGRIDFGDQAGIGVVIAAALRESKLEEGPFYSSLQV
jgi:hypothetical protein